MSSLLIRLVILIVASFAMLIVGTKINSDSLAVTRYMASSQAPIGAELYPLAAREQITVLMYDTQFLNEQKSAWPLSYMDHGDWLERIATNPAGRPKAIFLDITFGQQRNDRSLPSLIQTLCRIRGEYGVPIFLAALPSPVDGQLKTRPEIQAATLPDATPCVSLVGVRYTPDPIDRHAWNYPLSTHLAGKQWNPGPASDPASFRSAAMAIAQDVAGIDLGVETEPMALIWAAGRPGIQQEIDKPDLLSYCQASTFSGTRLIPDLLRQLWEDSDEIPPPCPIHQTLSMIQTETMSEEALAPYLVDRYVMVGAAVAGYNDLVNSPVHGLIPGVYLHAMALDNLLTYGDQYKQNSAWYPFPPAGLIGAGLLTIFIVFAIHIATRALRERLSIRLRVFLSRHARLAAKVQWLTDDAAIDPAASPRQIASAAGSRLLKGALQLFAWMLRLSIQAGLALLLISALQMCFRIGMLPVVELLGMTLFIEAFDYLKKIRLFLWPGTDNVPGIHKP
ncbi:CHASE2 domain-containing protein [Pigmentiphaga aceris]|uniref:CHASE2 domain-containing protein n=1 Tax=Pigmentiphaga aceris TaxID=1940612 RepID=UPI001652198D|nr:CHASE2 domain-containing protein [Pigmentiphaga aceris]